MSYPISTRPWASGGAWKPKLPTTRRGVRRSTARTSHGCSEGSAASCSRRYSAGTPSAHPAPTGASSRRSISARSPPAAARSSGGVSGTSSSRVVMITSSTGAIRSDSSALGVVLELVRAFDHEGTDRSGQRGDDRDRVGLHRDVEDAPAYGDRVLER